jgi:peptide/nickel transport system substrate-binding protein
MNIGLIPQMSFGPQKHLEFRQALSQAANRERIVESANAGRAEPTLNGTIWTKNHPWLNPDELTPLADSTSSNIETARSILEENDWTFDDDGRLHYPEDIDLTPSYPLGSEPAEHPEDFPSIEEFNIEPAE